MYEEALSAAKRLPCRVFFARSLRYIYAVRWLFVVTLFVLCGCNRNEPPRGTPSSRDAAVNDDGGSERIRLPRAPHLPGVDPSLMERDVPLGWLFLPVQPSLTGHPARVVFGVELPCGYQAVLGDSTSPPDPLQVRVRAHFRGPGRPGDACSRREIFVDYVPLQRLRLGNHTVTDRSLHGASEGPVPTVTQQVIADDTNAPSLQARTVRRCTPGQDTSCGNSGGVCGAVTSNVGVCVPPLDPYLFVGLACPTGTTAVALTHDGAYSVRPAPENGAPLRACLPSCDASHPCATSLECRSLSDAGSSVCVPSG